MMEKDQPNSVVEAPKNSVNEESKIKSNQESGDADKKSDGSNILVRTSKRVCFILRIIGINVLTVFNRNNNNILTIE